jgi:hypothetical protein
VIPTKKRTRSPVPQIKTTGDSIPDDLDLKITNAQRRSALCSHPVISLPIPENCHGKHGISTAM